MISWFVGENRGVSTSSLPLAQKTDIGTVLIHDGEPLDPMLRRPRLIDENDMRVEVALLAGQTLVDAVGDQMTDAPPVLAGG